MAYLFGHNVPCKEAASGTVNNHTHTPPSSADVVSGCLLFGTQSLFLSTFRFTAVIAAADVLASESESSFGHCDCEFQT